MSKQLPKNCAANSIHGGSWEQRTSLHDEETDDPTDTPSETIQNHMQTNTHTETEIEPIVTDGGTEKNDRSEMEDPQYHQLRDIFMTVTNDEKFVHEQEQDLSSRYINAVEENSTEEVSEYVTSTAIEDGLSDTLAEPEIESDTN